jgi:hypothetical protein
MDSSALASKIYPLHRLTGAMCKAFWPKRASFQEASPTHRLCSVLLAARQHGMDHGSTAWPELRQSVHQRDFLTGRLSVGSALCSRDREADPTLPGTSLRLQESGRDLVFDEHCGSFPQHGARIARTRRKTEVCDVDSAPGLSHAPQLRSDGIKGHPRKGEPAFTRLIST